MKFRRAFKNLFVSHRKPVDFVVRTKDQVMADIEKLDASDPDYDRRIWILFDEYRALFKEDRAKLDARMALPCRPQWNLTDEDLVSMASIVETMKLGAAVAVASVLDATRHDSLGMAVEQLRYQADFLRYVGYNECDFPDAFKWNTPEVAKEVICEWQTSGMTRQEIFEKAIAGFDELARVIKHPVLHRHGIAKMCDDSFWRYIPQEIRKSSRRLFDGGHFSEAVEAAYKEINALVKAEYLKRTAIEADGVDLMRRAFGSKTPVIELSQAEVAETRKNEQQGYMELFAGAMSALRNPKAHANVQLEKDDAVRQLMFAGMLLSRFILSVQAASMSDATNKTAVAG